VFAVLEIGRVLFFDIGPLKTRLSPADYRAFTRP
jgi:hypothetical protein